MCEYLFYIYAKIIAKVVFWLECTQLCCLFLTVSEPVECFQWNIKSRGSPCDQLFVEVLGEHGCAWERSHEPDQNTRKRSAVCLDARETNYVSLFLSSLGKRFHLYKKFQLALFQGICEVSDVLCFSGGLLCCLLVLFSFLMCPLEDVSLEFLFSFLKALISNM